MTRLTSELQRLYAPVPSNPLLSDADAFDLIDANGQVRALVLELGRPADWAALATVWQGVQADLGWPAPAIAVQGVDAYQMWFSLAEPLPAAQAQGVLQGLVARYLADVKPQRLRLLPLSDDALPLAVRHAALVPRRVADEQWSAFVSADLAPVFSDTPWLDLPPNLDGQAGLLAKLQSIQPDALQEAIARLRPALAPGAPAATAPADDTGLRGALVAGAQDDPRRFLLRVMNDDGVALVLRIEAAKALLPYVKA